MRKVDWQVWLWFAMTLAFALAMLVSSPRIYAARIGCCGPAAAPPAVSTPAPVVPAPMP